MPSTIENLLWRYATKQYDAAKKLSQEQRELMLEALRLAPSSYGLQPWKFVHVTQPELRQKLRAAAWNQPQVTDASELFVLCSVTALDEAFVDRFVAATATARHVSVDSLKDFRAMLVGFIQNHSADELREWSARQVYIALGVGLVAAADNQLDASPMEGFDPKQFDEILGLAELGVQSRVLLAVGFRSPEDNYQLAEKVRFPREQVFIER